MKKCILIDQDGVLADFEDRFYQIWKERGPCPPIDPSRRKQFYAQYDYPKEHFNFGMEIMAEPGFFLDMKPIDGAIEAVKAMASSGHELFICTSPLDDYRFCVPEKSAWVEKYLGPEFVKKMIFTKDKTMVSGDILIDDRPDITGVMSPVWQHIIFDAPYNRNVPAPRLWHWEDWYQVIEHNNLALSA
jgi:5'-nucleotidase